jgi:PAS domain-containing protein
MAANLTTDVAFRRSRHRAGKTAGAFENSGCIVAVEPNQYSTRDALLLDISPVEKSQVLFVVSFDADGIWRINQFDSAFAKIFGVPRSTDCDVTQFKLSLAFATRLASAMSRCAENGQSVKIDVPVRIAGDVHHWEFRLEPAHGSGARPSHILGHGTDVTSRRKTVRDLNRLTKKLLNA